MKKFIWPISILLLSVCINAVITKTKRSNTIQSRSANPPSINTSNQLTKPKPHFAPDRPIHNKLMDRDSIVFQELKSIEIENNDSSGKFDDLAELYLRNYLRDNPSADLNRVMNSILSGIENANSRSYLLSVFFSNINCRLPEIGDLLHGASNNKQDLDRYITSLRNNVFLLSMPFDRYYEVIKSLDEINDAPAIYDEILADKFFEKTTKVDQSQIVSMVDTLMNGSAQDQNIILSYLGKVSFEKSEEIMTDNHIEAENAALMFKHLSPQFSVTCPSRAIALLAKLKLDDTTRNEMETYLISEWRKADPVATDQWIRSIKDNVQRERLSGIFEEKSTK